MEYLQTQVWRYKFLSLFLVSLLVAVFLAASEPFHQWLLGLNSLEYLGAFLAGVLFVSSFTVATSTVVIAILSDNLNPLAIGLIGGAGAMIGDLLVFRFIKNHLIEELALLFGRRGTSYVKSVAQSKYIAWTLPIIGIFIIASPLPDELGISLLGLTKITETRLMLISFFSNAFGILAIASVAKVV